MEQKQAATQQPPTGGALTPYREILLLQVQDQASAAKMGELLKSLKTGVKNIEAWFKDLKDPAYAAWKALCAKETETLAPFATGIKDGQGRLDSWLQAEHRRQAAERQRIEEEKAREAAAEKERLQETAAVMEDLGQGTAAAELREEAERVVAAPAFVPTVSGTVRGEGATVAATSKLVVEVTDRKKFLRYLVEQNSEAVFVEFKKSMLDAWVKSQGLKPGQVPGLHIEYTVKSSIR